MEKRELSYALFGGGVVKIGNSHDGEQHGDSLKDEQKRYHMIQPSHSWTQVQRQITAKR